MGGILARMAGGRTWQWRLVQGMLALALGGTLLVVALVVGRSPPARSHQVPAESLSSVFEDLRTTRATAFFLAGLDHMAHHEVFAAMDMFTKASRMDPDNASYHLHLGWAANDAGKPELAREHLDRAILLDPGLGRAYWQRGVLLRRKGAVVDAERDLRRALELLPKLADAHADLAECYEDADQVGQAEVEWEAAIAGDPSRAFWRYRYGRLLFHDGHGTERALAETEKALALVERSNQKPPLAWVCSAHVDIATRLREDPRAATHVEAARTCLVGARDRRANVSPEAAAWLRTIDGSKL